VLTVSDSRTLAEDTLRRLPHRRPAPKPATSSPNARLLRDDRYQLRAKVSQWIADDGIDGVLVTGGTGFTGATPRPRHCCPCWTRRCRASASCSAR
jgi:molybdenum cofactor biosynthesis protein B